MVKGLVQPWRAWHDFGMRRALIACRTTETNEALARAGGDQLEQALLAGAEDGVPDHAPALLECAAPAELLALA